MRAVGKGQRAWGDVLLGRPWLLVALAALVIALPLVILGQASENDTRARLQAAQLESASRGADVVASNLRDRLGLIRSTLVTLTQNPRPDVSPIALAVQRSDLATLQALSDAVQRLYVRNVVRAYIAVRGQADSIVAAPIVVASPADTGLVGRRISDLADHPAVSPVFGVLGTGALSEVYADSPAVPTGARISASVQAPIPGDPQTASTLASAMIVAELDFARTFADAAAAYLTPGDDAYIIDRERRLVGRARAPISLPLLDLSGDPFVQLVGPASPAVARSGAVDPVAGGTRLIASAPVSGTSWSVILVRDTSTVDREIDGVLGQLAAARYVLVAVLVVGAFLIARAVEAQTRQRRALAQANRQIEAASLHKSAFLSNMSHELRTPLNSINGFSDVLLTGMAGTLSDKQREYLSDIRGSGEHLLRLVNDILDLSKVEAGRMELQPSEFDLRETLESVHRTVAPLAHEKSQTLRLADDAGGIVRLDDGQARSFSPRDVWEHPDQAKGASDGTTSGAAGVQGGRASADPRDP